MTALIGLSPVVVWFGNIVIENISKNIVPLIQQKSEKWADRFTQPIESSLSPFEQEYYQSLIYTYRDYRTQGLKTKGPFTLDLEKVFVPLRIAPESANRISAEMIRKMIHSSRESQDLKIWDFFQS